MSKKVIKGWVPKNIPIADIVSWDNYGDLVTEISQSEMSLKTWTTDDGLPGKKVTITIEIDD